MTRRTSTILRIVLILAVAFGAYWMTGVEFIAGLLEAGDPERTYWRIARLVVIALLVIVLIFRLTRPKS